MLASFTFFACTESAEAAVKIKIKDIEVKFREQPIVDGIKYIVTKIEEFIGESSLLQENSRLIIDETSTEIRGVFSGLGAILSDENIPLTFEGNHWDFNATLRVLDEIVLENTWDDADRAFITSGSLIHKSDPDDGGQPHGLADALDPRVSYIANESMLNPGQQDKFSKDAVGSSSHPPHRDFLLYSRLRGDVSRDASFLLGDEDWQIDGFAYEFRATHSVPGPLPLLSPLVALRYARKLKKKFKPLNK
jgi:hypothetical protein